LNQIELENQILKNITGKTLDELTRIETFEEVAEREIKIALEADGNDNEVFPIGYKVEDGSPVFISDAERANSHMAIIGAPRQGKSRLIELLVRHDIDRLRDDQKRRISPKKARSFGLCVIDPTSRGGTINNILAYCAQVGFKKVLVVDPYRYHTHNVVPVINPFGKEKTHWGSSTDYLVDAFRVLYEVPDPSLTSYITNYLSFLFSTFHYADLTVDELLYFTSPKEEKIEELAEIAMMRERIVARVRQVMNAENFPGDLREIAKTQLGNVQFALSNIPNFRQEWGSTARRINTLVTNRYLKLIFGHRDGIDFEQLVTDGWVILVNVATGKGLGILQSRLLATVIINEIIGALERVYENGYRKHYNLYIDEAGQYTTYELANVLEYKRHLGISAVLAHQHLGQLENDRIRGAIMNCTDLKCSFHVADPTEREKVVKMMGYGGQLHPDDVAHNLYGQKKQEMILQLPKRPPVWVKVPEVPNATGNVERFLDQLFKDNHYLTHSQIQEDVRERHKLLPVGEAVIRPKGAAKSNNRPTGGAPKPKAGHGAKNAQKDVVKKAAPRDPDSNAQPDMAWEDLFLANGGDKSETD